MTNFDEEKNEHPLVVQDTGKSAFNTSSSGVAEIGASGTVTKEISQKIVLLPIAPKFGTQEVNRFSQSPA